MQLKAAGALEENGGHRPVQYLNNVLEQDHRAIKRRVKASRVRLRQACLKAGIKDARVKKALITGTLPPTFGRS